MLPWLRAVAISALDAWTGAFRALWAMPKLTGTAFVALLLCEFLFWLAGIPVIPGHDSDLRILLPNLVETITASGITASLAIAIQRFVILGEATQRPVWRVTPEYPLYLGWLLLLNVGLGLVVTILGASIGLASIAAGRIVGMLGGVGIIVIQLRLLLLFPALAVQAEGDEARAAWADSRGRAWRYFAVAFLAFVPGLILQLRIMALTAESYWMMSHVGWPHGMPWGFAVLNALTYLLGGSAAAVMAARFFQQDAKALLQSPALPIQTESPQPG